MNYGHEQNEDAGQMVRKPRRDRPQRSSDKSESEKQTKDTVAKARS